MQEQFDCIWSLRAGRVRCAHGPLRHGLAHPARAAGTTLVLLARLLSVQLASAPMATPRKRKNSRTENRATQRYTPPGGPHDTVRSESIPRPPSTCQPHHYYWCDGHNDWHHHDEFVISAFERIMAQGQATQDRANHENE